MNSTLATVIIEADDQTEALKDFPEYFFTGLSATGISPATHFVTNGYFADEELNKIVNDVAWPRKVYFGELQEVINQQGLVLVNDSPVER